MSARKTPAEQLGIVIGKTVIREDWRCSSPEANRTWFRMPGKGGAIIPMLGTLIIRDNHITLAGSDDDSPVFKYWSVEQPPEPLAA